MIYWCLMRTQQESKQEMHGGPLRGYAASLLINRNYALFTGGSFVSALGSWLQAVAIGWLVLELGNSTFLLGLANFAQMIPLLVLGVFGGAVADRVDRRRLLLVTQTGAVVVNGVLALLTATGGITIPLILLLALALGTLNAFVWPTWSAFIKDLVGPAQLRAAIAVNSARFNLTRVIGPAVGGYLIAKVGTAAVLGLGTITIFGVIASLLLIRVPAADPAPSSPLLSSLREGLSYTWQNQTARRLLFETGTLGLLGMPYQTLLPAFARDTLRIGPEGLGLLLTAVGIGAIVGAVLSGSPRTSRNPRRGMRLFVFVTATGLLATAAAASLPVALLGLALVGLGSIAFLSTANASLQLAVPDHLVGRVMGLWVVMNAGTMPLGSLLYGAGAEHAGVQGMIGLGGMAIGVLGLTMLADRRPARGAGGSPTPV